MLLPFCYDERSTLCACVFLFIFFIFVVARPFLSYGLSLLRTFNAIELVYIVRKFNCFSMMKICSRNVLV